MQGPPGYPPHGGGYPPPGGGYPPQGGHPQPGGPPQAGYPQPGGPPQAGYPQPGGPPQAGYPQPGGYGAPPPGYGPGYGPPPGAPAQGGYGGPPGYGAPPGPPKKDGPNVALIVGIALVVVIASSFGGCLFCAYVGGSSSGDTGATATDSDFSEGDWITSERPFVKFQAPPGWVKDIKNDWAVFVSPDGTATVAFTTFDRPGESTVKLGQAAGTLGVSDIAWGSPKSGTVGKDAFPARIGDGSCNFKGPRGYIEYATVNPGGSDQLLLIYAVTANAVPARKAEAQVAFRSLQRR